ncbi:WD40 repeat domain-containing serine/threonine protein kinase [Nocardia huaxiensis]|uniref:WD40 repeat domain-containing serine/threonine protein kinase n=1 Tax=Nocardia huaxiensis TaxID=2755382 RepID=UPI001E2EF523|nr:serine/threonine-protein kinase [Nocardia huaxiensis]UFS93827.1 protein kinase [Nocardia huaxiensis]
MDLQPGDVLAGYTIRLLLGSGGMGKVYLAQHPRMKRKIALKVLSESMAADETVRSRFEREAELTAELEHPNIVPVYDHSAAGDAVLWIAMGYVQGGDAAQLLRDAGPFAAERAVALIADAARGLDHAHANNVLHRDVKPANLLVRRESGGREHGLVTDFGIARSLGDTPTRSGLVTTLAYTAPERFRGEVTDRRSDVYSLGCTLFEFLTGRRPFVAADAAALIGAHLGRKPQRVSELRPGTPPGFDAVIAQALAKNPADRYPTCGALADAAGRALTAAPVERVAPVRETRAQPAAGKPPEPGPATVSGTARAKAVAVSPDGSLLATAGPETVRWLAVDDPAQATAHTEPGHHGRHRAGRDTSDFAVAFSPDGTMLAASASGSLGLWDVRSGERSPITLNVTGDVVDLSFSPDSRLLAVGTTYDVYLYDLQRAGSMRRVLIGSWGVSSIAFTPAGDLAIGTKIGVALYNTSLVRWDLLPLALRSTSQYSHSIRHLVFSPVDSLAAAVINETTVQLWDTAATQLLEPALTRSGAAFTRLAFGPKGTLAAATAAGAVYLSDPRTREELGPALTGHQGPVTGLAFHPDGAWLATCSGDEAVRLWRL